MAMNGVWGEILRKVPKAEQNEVAKYIGQKKIDMNQDLWREYYVMNEILLETRCFGESNPLPGIEQSKIFDSKTGKYIQRANLRILNSSEITLEKVRDQIDSIQSAFDLEISDLEDEIRIIQDTIDMRADYFLCSQGNSASSTPQSPATKDDMSSRDTSSSYSTEIPSKYPVQLLTSKSEQKLTSLSTLTKSTNSATLSSSAMSYHTPRLCSKCNGRMDSEALVQFNSNNRSRQKYLPICTICKEMERKLKKSESKTSNIPKADSQKLSMGSFDTTASNGRGLGIAVPSTPLLASFHAASPIPPISSFSRMGDDLRSGLSSAEKPVNSADSSKFRRRLQSVRDEKHFFDDDF